jgi:anthranilate synthase/aminodeoxychorismate synthase-like glutamine amidotransferase
MSEKILVIDNYDSFVHNLARYVGMTGATCTVARNDSLSIADIRAMNLLAIVLSPGPCTPKEAGICLEAIKNLSADIPIFGVCLGHQCIGEAFGLETRRAPEPMHGKSSVINHREIGIFKNIKNPLRVGRYHSLISAPIDPKKTAPLHITAETDDGIIMGLQHETHPVFGVQFHPESILTEQGPEMIANFIRIAREFQTQNPAAKRSAA